MTIVTKPLSEKKEEKTSNQEPLVAEVKVLVPEPSTSGSSKNVKGSHSRIQVRHVFKTRVVPTYIGIGFLLLLLPISILPILIVRDTMLSNKMYRGWCRIPYKDLSPETSMQQAQVAHVDMNNNFFDQIKKLALMIDKTTEKFFREEFEINNDSEKITIPEFRGGRRCRFVHDFKTNVTGIIDLNGRRCFVLPLNRSVILPPKGLMDVIKKMNSGYYDLDSNVLRETMRVVTPAIEERADLGSYIMDECYNFPIYKLEKYVPSVIKRSVSEEGKFVVFSGKGTQELRIINYGDLAEHEVDGPVAMA